MKFSDVVDIGFYLSTYYHVDDMVNAIKRLQIRGGNTNIAMALRTARNQMFSARSRRSRLTGAIPRLLILVTDGTATEEGGATVPEANLTKAAGIRIFAVGIGRHIDDRQLKIIATAPWESHYFYVSDFSALQSVVESVLERSCQESATLTVPIETTTPTASPATTTIGVPVPTTTTTTTTTATALTTTTLTTTTAYGKKNNTLTIDSRYIEIVLLLG